MISFVGKCRVDPQVEQSINMTITAGQKSIEAENKIKQSLAEAQQKIAEADGEAKSVAIRAVAKAEANRILTQSLSPELLQYEALQKWDGKMPTYLGGSGQLPFITKELK
jgi:regulator of protease activity HflC (stomatin/prohibitin superfamily)